MKKLSEVCKIVGVTRRTLQEYNKIELLKPTCISESGYWYYDDNAIGILLVIRIFLEAGYERLAIKEFLNSSIKDNNQVFGELLNSLEEKKKRIDGMIKTVRMLNSTLNFPEKTLAALEKIDLANVYQEKSFVDVFNDTVNTLSDFDMSEQEEAELVVPFLYNLIAIANSSDLPIDSNEVKTIFDDMFVSFKKIILNNNESSGDSLLFNDTDVADIIIELIADIKNDSDMGKLIKNHSSAGGLEYVEKVICYYRSILER